MGNLNQGMVAAGKKAVRDLGTEIRVMTRSSESETVFLKPMDSDQAKLLLVYVQALEDELTTWRTKSLDSEHMANKFGVAVVALTKIKEIPEMASDLKVKAIKDIVDKVFIEIEKA